MFKIAGELTPTVFHIAARSVAAHALSIFGDHSDVMTTRTTGFAMLFASSIQEVMDMAVIAHATTLKSRIPFLHVFDGFRTSHEINIIETVADDVLREMIDLKAVEDLKDRALNPDNPFIRGTAMNPDVFFQSREAVNNYYLQLPDILKQTMDQFGHLTGRKYDPFDYFGHPEAERIIVAMGSGAGAIKEAVQYLNGDAEKVGFINVHLYRPFSMNDFISKVPKSVKSIAVLDRTKEPGSLGEPLYQDVVNVFNEVELEGTPPTIIGGRYGLSSKEFTPAMALGIFNELKKQKPTKHFTIGIFDDVTKISLDYDKSLTLEGHAFSGIFYGLGSDGTVSANKNSIKIIGESTDKYVQGYFVYDSKKAGAVTISHLRFDDQDIQSTYLIEQADFVACHQFVFLEKYDVLSKAKQKATFLLNAPYSATDVWDKLPKKVQKQIISKELEFYVINATKVAADLKLGKRINTILQTCFFVISGILPKVKAIDLIKKAIIKTYASKGEILLQRNFDAVDGASKKLQKVKYPKQVTSQTEMKSTVPDAAPDFVQQVLAKIMRGEGNELPVSAFPVDGTFPSGTSKWEKRNIADFVPVLDEELCTQCNKCLLICPHAAIRAKVVDKKWVENAPEGFKTMPPVGKEFDGENEVYTLQVAVEDCTGCDLCVEICPIESKVEENHKALNMVDRLHALENGIKNWDYFIGLPEIDRRRVNKTSVKGSQFLQPLFEFSGACSGCGETPYLKLLTQLYGDRLLIANATGCSSIYGGNLPTTPWTINRDGKGPAWSNSLFEDNAEFGLGMKLAVESKHINAKQALKHLAPIVSEGLTNEILQVDIKTEEGLIKLKNSIHSLNAKLKEIGSREALDLMSRSDNLIEKTVWIVGGDGWAYDIGFGGLDHVLASGIDINILVLDTEVYSNTGGQTSKATPPAASAKFSISGKTTPKKDLSMHAIGYGNVYVAQVALGAKDGQTVRAMNEAHNFPGPSIIIAYSNCIEHGYEMRDAVKHQDKAVKSGYWPLYRYNPNNEPGKRFILDSKEPSIDLEEYIYEESRYSKLIKQNSGKAKELLLLAKADIDNKWTRINSVRHL